MKAGTLVRDKLTGEVGIVTIGSSGWVKVWLIAQCGAGWYEPHDLIVISKKFE